MAPTTSNDFVHEGARVLMDVPHRSLFRELSDETVHWHVIVTSNKCTTYASERHIYLNGGTSIFFARANHALPHSRDYIQPFTNFVLKLLILISPRFLVRYS